MQKLTSLNLDPLLTILAPFYSYTGRPARNQPELFRSFILMLDLGQTSIDRWIASDDLLAILISCPSDSLPPLSSYYDLIDRLWIHHKELDKADRKRLYHFPRSKRPTSKPRKGKSSSTGIQTLSKKCFSYPTRILNDYHLHVIRTRGKKRYSFITMMIGINIHLDARIKKAQIDAA